MRIGLVVSLLALTACAGTRATSAPPSAGGSPQGEPAQPAPALADPSEVAQVPAGMQRLVVPNLGVSVVVPADAVLDAPGSVQNIVQGGVTILKLGSPSVVDAGTAEGAENAAKREEGATNVVHHEIGGGWCITFNSSEPSSVTRCRLSVGALEIMCISYRSPGTAPDAALAACRSVAAR